MGRMGVRSVLGVRLNRLQQLILSRRTELQSATAGTRPGESHWRCGTWSPTGLSSLGGRVLPSPLGKRSPNLTFFLLSHSCVIAAVTTNHEALLFEPEKNAYKGTWKEVSRFEYKASAELILLRTDLRFDLAPRQIGHQR